MSEAETLSEQLFEQYCRENGIRIEKIRRDKNRTPDYDIYPSGKRVVVEVKQIDPNDDDVAAEKELTEGAVCSIIDSSPGKRIRKKKMPPLKYHKERKING